MASFVVRVAGVLAIAGCAVLAYGCDDGERFIDVDSLRDRHLPGDVDGGAEAGVGMDSGPPADGSTIPDGATMDAAALGLDGSLRLPDGSWILEDGAILLPDGQIIDLDEAIMRFGPDPTVESCELEEEDIWQAEVEFEDQGGFSIAPGPTGFGLAYRAIGRSTCADNIEVMLIPERGEFPQPKPLLSDCSVITDVALAAAGDGWHVGWVDNFARTAELQGAALDDEMNLGEGGRRMLTEDASSLESKPVVANIAGRPLVAWTAFNGTDDAYRIAAHWLDGDAQASELVAASEGHEPQGLALSQVGHENAVVGWVGPDSNPGVWLLRLDSSGERAGNPIRLTTRVSVSSSISLAAHEGGGAAVYSIEIDGVPQVRFRRLDETGMPIADERIVVGAPLVAKDASIFPLGTGYGVAYRALPGGSISEPQIRMTFISRDGHVMRDAAGTALSIPIAAATQASARVQLAVSVEGQLLIAWLDAHPTSSNNALKVVRRSLSCN